MYTILLLAFITAASAQHCCAQQLTWELRIGERMLLRGTETDKTDTLQLLPADTGKHRGITLHFREKRSNLIWRYVLVCTDSVGNMVVERPCGIDTDACTISFPELMLAGRRNRYLSCFLEQHPSDPESSIRSRRTPLAVLQLHNFP